MSEAKKGSKPQTIYIIRHGDRMDRGVDAESKAWQEKNPGEEDTPISYIGREQAKQNAELLMKEIDVSNTILIASPWIRCMQTALPFATASKLKMRLDSAVGEGAEFRTHDAPDNSVRPEFKDIVDRSYSKLLEGKIPDINMKNVADALEKRYGFKEGRTIVFFSHADPCIYLAAALSNVGTEHINVASACSMWTLKQYKEKSPYKIVRNGRIDQLKVYGETRPWHHNPVMVKMWRDHGWPPPKQSEKETFAKYMEAYHKLHVPLKE